MTSLRASLIFFASLFLFSEFILGIAFGWQNASYCYRYLGCNAGFLGFDSVTHLLSGMTEVLLVLWLATRFEFFDFVTANLKKNVFIIFVIVILLSIGWEVWEFSYDHVIKPAVTLQLGTEDTVGDLTSALAGALIMISILGVANKKLLQETEAESGTEPVLAGI